MCESEKCEIKIIHRHYIENKENPMQFNPKLGKTAARKGAISVNFADYVSPKLPAPPVHAGHQDVLKGLVLGMLGNDKYGDCVWAGAAHETMLWNKQAGMLIPMNETAVLSDYAACTGFNPKDPNSDQGTDMQLAAKYRQDTGILDANGKRHKVGAYLALHNDKEIRQAVYLFSAVGIGIRFPNYAMQQFNAGKDWVVEMGGTIEGGHYIPGITYDRQFVYVVTWGKIIRASWAFIRKYMDEGVVYLSEEMLTAGKSMEGFDLATLQADIKAIKG